MLNQVAVEALYSATYVENYLDSVENLPDDVQRHLSRIRDIDVQYRSHLRDVDYYYEQWRNTSANPNDSTSSKRIRSIARMQQNLIAAQELGDEKMQIVNQLQELIDQKTRQLDLDFKNLDYGKEEQSPEVAQKMPRPPTPTVAVPTSVKVESQPFAVTPSITQRGNTPTSQPSERTPVSNNNNSSSERANKRSRRPRNEALSMDVGGSEPSSISEAPTQKQSTMSQSSSNSSQKKASGTSGGKKKKRKARGQTNTQTSARDARDETPPQEAIDPDEPTYCLCDQISFGEMILCDNDLCPIEWFHFSCVSLMSKPKGKWFCPNCRGDRPNVMKPKAQFLKELERYNKEKEEKT